MAMYAKMKKENILSKLLWCWQFTRKEMPLVYISLLLSIILSYLYSFEPLLTGSLMDILSLGDFSSFITTLVVLFILQTCGLFLSLLLGRLNFTVEKRSTLRCESLFFSSIIKRKRYGFLKGREAEVLNIIKSDISVVTSVWTTTLPGLVTSLFTLFIVSWRLIVLNTYAFILTIVFAIFPIVVYQIAGKKERKLNVDAKIFGDNYISSIQSSINASYLSTGNGSSFFKQFFISRLEDNYSVSFKKLNLSQNTRIALFFINVITVSAIYFFLGLGIYRGENSVGDFMAAVLFSQQIRNIINGYGSVYKNLLAQSVSIDRVKSMLETETHPYISYYPLEKLELSAHSISFKYDSKMIIDKMSFSFEAPGLYLIKGENGSGKTTLINLIAGLLENKGLQNGRITISGCISSDDLLLIPSSLFLFPSTVRDNLLWGDKVDDKVLISNIERVGLMPWFMDLKDGFDTIVDPKVLGLSKGQMIRFALASALSRERKIYLFDEIESGIDVSSKEMLRKTIAQLSKSKLVIIVSHSNLFDDISKGEINT